MINKELKATRYYNKYKRVYGMYEIINKDNIIIDIVERELHFNSEEVPFIKYKNIEVKVYI